MYSFIGMTVLSLLAFIFVLFSNLLPARTEVENAQETLKFEEDFLNQIELQTGDADIDQDELAAKIPFSANMEYWNYDLSLLEEETQVEVTSIDISEHEWQSAADSDQPNEETTSTRATVIEVSLFGQANGYESLHRFLSSVESSERLTSIERLTLNSPIIEEETEILTFNATIQLYYIPSNTISSDTDSNIFENPAEAFDPFE